MEALDTSLLASPGYGAKDFSDELREKLERILRREFPASRPKQKVKAEASGYAVACPYCGDSASSPYKKRGHLLLNGKWAGYYKCFNCGKFTSIDRFMSDFKENLSVSGLKFVADHKEDVRIVRNENGNELSADVLQKQTALKWGIDRTVLRDRLSLSEIDKTFRGMGGYQYLTKRAQFDFRKFLYDSKTASVVILNLCDDKVIGCQIRRIGPGVKKDRRFLTFTLDKIYERFFGADGSAVPKDLVTIGTFFGIYSVNVYKPVIVTEGPMDAFLLPNAVASCGANKKIELPIPFWYMYDADDTGNRKAIEKLRNGCHVFAWGKLKADLGLPRRRKWDVNDVVLWLRQNRPETVVRWLDYFTDNPLDMMRLDDLRMV